MATKEETQNTHALFQFIRGYCKPWMILEGLVYLNYINAEIYFDNFYALKEMNS